MIRNYIIALLSACLLAACGDDDAPAVKPQVSRTVLVYIVANNSLSGYDARDINEMLVAASAGDLNGGRLLVYHAARGHNPLLKEVTAEGIVDIKEYKDYADGVSSVSVEAMRRVFDDMRAIAPADDYGLVLWSHATGWIDNGNSPEKEVRRSFGIDGNKEMSIPSLGEALMGEHFSFIYFDCCFMGNIESLYEIKGSADYVVASPAETPLDGMPYDLNVGCFFREVPDMVGAASNTFETYNAMTGRYRSSTMAVYDMSAIDDVMMSARAILASNTRVDDVGAIQQYGGGRSFGDRFYDLDGYMRSLTDDEELLGAFDESMSRFVIYAANTPEMYLSSHIELNNCCGVSCYIVNDTGGTLLLPLNYQDLKWWNDVVAPTFYF